MSHISEISLSNFKLFKNELFQFKPITVLTGTNSSGKTSVIQALRILSSYFGLNNKRPGMTFNSMEKLTLEQIGERLGDFSKILSRGAETNTIAFGLPIVMKGVDDQITLYIKFTQSTDPLKEGELTSLAFHSRKTDSYFLSIEKSGQSWNTTISYLFFWVEFNKALELKKTSKKLILLWKHSRDGAADEMKSLFDKLSGLFPNHEITIDENNVLILKNSSYAYHHFFETDEIPYMLPLLNYSLMDDEESADDEKEEDIDIGKFSREEMIEWLKKERKKEEEEKESRAERAERLQSQIRVYDKYIENHEEFDKELQDSLLRKFAFTYHPKSSNNVLDAIINTIGHPVEAINNKSAQIDLKLEGLINDFSKANKFSIAVSSTEEESVFKDATPSAGMMFFEHFVSQNILFSLQSLANTFMNIGYLSSIRNIVKRAYGNRREETEFNDLILEFQAHRLDTKKKITSFINDYVQKFEIGDRILIERDIEGISSRFYVEKGRDKMLLADLGYGISQFMPILLKIAIQADNHYNSSDNVFQPSVICIEEPETNLHPALQSKLADLFVDANQRFNIQFIIETHSEYMIRKLQYLVGTGEVTSDDLLLYYFEKGQEGEREIKRLMLKPDGSLTDDFGSGFFDEAIHWKFELVKLANAQRN